jgi:hypothetical protein
MELFQKHLAYYNLYMYGFVRINYKIEYTHNE